MKTSSAEEILESQRNRLSRWLREWELDQVLRNVPEETAPRAQVAAWRMRGAASRPAKGRPEMKMLRAGDIFLLPPGPRSSHERPVYVVILESKSKGFLIAPFGRFSVPASSQEWQTGIATAPLRVLCLWNSRIIEERFLRICWLSGRFSRTGVRKALQILGTAEQGWHASATSFPNVGPPILHPLDPRLVYQAEEAELLDGILEALRKRSAAALPARREDSSSLYETGSNMALAAESHTRYGRKSRSRRARGKGRK